MAKTKIEWWRAAAGMSPCSRYQAARVPPHPGQSNPVKSFITHVGASVAPAEVGRISSVYATPAGQQRGQPERRHPPRHPVHQPGDPPFRRRHVGVLVTGAAAARDHRRQALGARQGRAGQQVRRQPVTRARPEGVTSGLYATPLTHPLLPPHGRRSGAQALARSAARSPATGGSTRPAPASPRTCAAPPQRRRHLPRDGAPRPSRLDPRGRHQQRAAGGRPSGRPGRRAGRRAGTAARSSHRPAAAAGRRSRCGS